MQEVYGDQLQIDYVMGGLTDDSESVRDPVNAIGGSDWKRQVAAHWLDASRRHGMPVDITQFVEIAPKSTYPANIAYEAAKLQNAEIAHSYVRRLREAAATESMSIHLPDVQAEYAEELGLDRERFLTDIARPAKEAFEGDRRECEKMGVHGFPTFLIINDEREHLLRGYRSFEEMEVIID